MNWSRVTACMMGHAGVVERERRTVSSSGRDTAEARPRSTCSAPPCTNTHVFTYEQALARLLPDVGRDMRETELAVQAPDGSLPHRVVLPLYLPQLHGEVGGPERPALDGMVGAVLKTCRSVPDGA